MNPPSSLPLSGLLRLTAFVFTASVASAQFTWEGSDNFDDNTLTVPGPRWAIQSTGGSTAWTEQNGRIEFTGDQGALTPSFRGLGWNAGADLASTYTTPWVWQSEFSLAHQSNGNFVQMGMQARTSNTGEGLGGFGVYLFRNNDVTQLGATYTRSPDIAFENLAQVSLPNTAITDLQVQITWNPTTEMFNSAYRFDTGTAFTSLATFDAGTLWTATPAGFFTNLVARAETGENIVSGGMYFDNVSVSAIPEPSAFAALIGLVTLGLAATRRRRRQS